MRMHLGVRSKLLIVEGQVQRCFHKKIKEGQTVGEMLIQGETPNTCSTVEILGITVFASKIRRYIYMIPTLRRVNIQEIPMCTCKNPWISNTVDTARKILDPRVQVAISVYDLFCTLCREK